MHHSLLRTDEEITHIYNKYASTVYRIAMMLLKNRAEAQDVTQSVFVKLITVETGFETDEHIKAWLIVTTQNTCKNLLKSWWWSRRADSSHVLEQAYTMDSTESQIWQALTSLPVKLKLPLYLHYFEGYQTGEIADMMHMKPATVRTRLWTARNRLKLMLEEESKHEND